MVMTDIMVCGEAEKLSQGKCHSTYYEITGILYLQNYFLLDTIP
jgi:hypothetical protein